MTSTKTVPTHALEPYDTIFTLFGHFTPDQQLDMIRAAMLTADDAGDSFYTMFEAYFREEHRLIWDIFIVAADTHGEGDERTFSGPDGLWIDPDGRLFIQTDAGQKKGLNNQMLVASTSDSDGNPQLRRRQLRRGGHAWSGGAEKADDERSAEGLDHEPRVDEVRVEAELLRIKQRPQ